MSQTVSFRINTDPTHTEESGGYPGGTVTIDFFEDDSDYPPGTEGLQLDYSRQMGSIVLKLSPSIAGHFDGWYFIEDRKSIESFPNRIRDAIMGFMSQSMAASRINVTIGKLVNELPSERQRETIAVITRVIMAIVLEQPINANMSVWPEDVTAGYILVTPNSEYVAGRRFESYSEAAAACAQSGDPDMSVGVLTVYPNGQKDENIDFVYRDSED